MKLLALLCLCGIAARGDERAVVEKLHERIAAVSQSAFVTYKKTIPGTAVAVDMAAVPGGEFRMGSAASGEGPVHRVRIAPFWMQKFEVTWDQYRLFMSAAQAGELERKDEVVDAISRPTRPYVEMSFGMGIEGYPAISMTQHAANKFAEWLSARTGEFYRLPTEAEWEYACRAGGAETAGPLGDYAWYGANSGGKYQKIGAKKPNAWGLYDMLGNVMEWTLDQYDEAFYAKSDGASGPWNRATKAYPHAVRGGSWNDEEAALRCSARVPSDASWKQQDPQLPKSIWYHTDAQWLGFRVVRPVKVPSAEEMYRYWNSGVEKE